MNSFPQHPPPAGAPLYGAQLPWDRVISVPPQCIVAQGTVTLANMKISAAPGNAFVDFGTAVFTPDMVAAHDYVEITAKTLGWKIGFYAKALGTGETYTDYIGGTNPALRNGDFSAGDTVWTKGTGWAITDVATHSAGTGSSLKQSPIATPAGMLLLSGVTVNSILGGAIGFIVSNSSVENISTTGAKTLLKTSGAGGDMGISAEAATNVEIDTYFLRQMITPSATGITGTSTPGESVFNLTRKDPLFNYSDAAGYSYRVLSPAIFNDLFVNRKYWLMPQGGMIPPHILHRRAA